MKRRGQNLCKACYSNTLIYTLGCMKRVLRFVSVYSATCTSHYHLHHTCFTVIGHSNWCCGESQSKSWQRGIYPTKHHWHTTARRSTVDFNFAIQDQTNDIVFYFYFFNVGYQSNNTNVNTTWKYEICINIMKLWWNVIIIPVQRPGTSLRWIQWPHQVMTIFHFHYKGECYIT